MASFCCSSWLSFATEGTGFQSRFPGLKMHVLTLKTNLRMPFMREYLLLHGLSDVSRETCIKILNRSILNTSCADRHAVCPMLQSEQQLMARRLMVHTAKHLCTPHCLFGDDSIAYVWCTLSLHVLQACHLSDYAICHMIGQAKVTIFKPHCLHLIYCT